MKLTVYKYGVPVTDDIFIGLPKGAKILSFGVPPEGGYAVWVLINPEENEIEQRHFRLAGTGHLLDEERLQFIGTSLIEESLVFHLFEVLN